MEANRVNKRYSLMPICVGMIVVIGTIMLFFALLMFCMSMPVSRISTLGSISIILTAASVCLWFCFRLFKRLGKKGSIIEHAWPEYRKDSLETDEVLVVVQINGKLRSKFTITAESDEALIRQTALADEKIKKHIGDKEPKKVIIIRKKQALVNIVI